MESTFNFGLSIGFGNCIWAYNTLIEKKVKPNISFFYVIYAYKISTSYVALLLFFVGFFFLSKVQVKLRPYTMYSLVS